jgi:hypothetical protein
MHLPTLTTHPLFYARAGRVEFLFYVGNVGNVGNVGFAVNQTAEIGRNDLESISQLKGHEKYSRQDTNCASPCGRVVDWVGAGKPGVQTGATPFRVNPGIP